MEYGVSSAALSASKKLPNGFGCRFSGKSAYAGIFSTPVKLKLSSLPSRIEDYCEIFGVSEAARGASIPTLEVSEINERTTEFRHTSSKVDYSKVFGGLGDVDTAVPYTELLGQPKRKTSLPKQESSSAKRRIPSKAEDVSVHISNDPVVFHEASSEFDGPKKISVSYNKINQGDRKGARSTTHISQLQTVPVYTCLVDEISSLKVNKANGYERSVPNVAHCGDSNIEIVQEREACTRSNTIPQADVKTQRPTSSMKSDRCLSDLNTQTFDEHAIDNGAWQMKMSPPETLAHDSGNHNNFRRSENKSQVSNSDASERGSFRNDTYSPPELADSMDFNSEAAASVAVLKKAIEEAQEKFKFAKESTWRRNEGLEDRVKTKSNDKLRRGKNVGSVANRINITEEMKPQMIREEMRDSVQILSGIERQMETAGVAANLIDRKIHSATEEAVTETLKESLKTQWVSKLEDMGLKEDIFYEFAHTGRSDEPKSESEHFYEFVGRGKSEEAKLNSEQVTDKVIAPYATDVCGENDERENGNDFNWLEDGRETVKVVDKELRRDKTENHVDPGNGLCEHENFKCEFGSVQGMQDHVRNENRVNFPVKQNGLEKKLDIPHEHEKYESTVIKFVKPTDKNCISHFQKENGNSVEASLAEQSERDLRLLGKSVIDENIPAQVWKENVEINPSGLEEPQEWIYGDILRESHELQLNLDSQIESQNQIKHGRETSILDENEEDQEYTCKEEDIVKSIENVFEQKMVEKTMDHICANKEKEGRHGEGADLGENKMEVDDKNDEDVLTAVTAGIKENNRERKRASEWVAVGRNCTSTLARSVGENADVLEDVSKHVNYSDERLNLSELDETEIQNGEVESTIFSQKEENLVNMELSDDLGDVLQETVKERNNFVDAVQTETTEKTINMTAEENEEECVDAADTVCNLGEIGKVTPNVVNFSNNTKQDDISVPQDVEESSGTFTSERMAGTENYVEVATTESPTSSEQDADTIELHEIEIGKHREDAKENDQTSVRMEEKNNDCTQDNLGKVEMEKECPRKIEEAREREKEKEKLAVERASREARERAFADARERAEKAALQRAATKARHRMMTETRETLGKNCSQANDESFAEKAALEAKLKAERSAVERASAEARARALERAMSEKALSEERNKDAQHSTSWSSSTFRYSRSSDYGATHSSGDLGGYCGESAQRCKARSERHQRVMERAAKALAEKSMRDHLAQKEQEERNRLAETLDADIKRWSSGKEGNLRALLSSLHYILGPTSGWQPIPLTDMVTTTAVKKAYRKATLFVHPDKLQQRGASIRQKYTCEKVFDLLKEAWNRLNV